MMYHATTANCSSRHLRQASLLLVGLLLLGLASYAHARCNTLNYRAGTVSFPSETILLPNPIRANDVLWTSPPAPVSNPPSGTCTGRTKNGLENQLPGSGTSSDDTLFPTGVSGLSYRILFTDSNDFPNASSGISAYPNQASGTGNISFSGMAQLQLVVTDPAAFAAVNSPQISGSVARWYVDACFLGFFCRKYDAVDFGVGAITFAPPSCNAPAKTVTLPTVMSTEFSGTGSTAGEKSFSFQLTCSSSATVSITLTSNTAASDPPDLGVITNDGSAKGVGVQMLDENGNPVDFGNPILVGTITTAGILNVKLKARYYQTGRKVKAGLVKATATYTLTYQ